MADPVAIAQVDQALDPSLVLNWHSRSKRVRKAPPPTYWEEFVATDPWYVRELLADVPPEEYHAAVSCEDWDEDEGEDADEDEGEGDVEESDADYSESVDESHGGDSTDEGSGESVESDVDLDSNDSTFTPSGSPPNTPEYARNYPSPHKTTETEQGK